MKIEINMKTRLLLLLFASISASFAQAQEKPNIVYVICDDLGYGDVQCLNPERGKIPTPGVDRLASEGMIFTNAQLGIVRLHSNTLRHHDRALQLALPTAARRRAGI